jgi:hypothetical protein
MTLIRIRTDMHSFSKLDPYPHSLKKPDPGPYKVNVDPKHCTDRGRAETATLLHMMLQVTVERDLAICRLVQRNPVLWTILEGLALHRPALCYCSVIIRYCNPSGNLPTLDYSRGTGTTQTSTLLLLCNHQGIGLAICRLWTIVEGLALRRPALCYCSVIIRESVWQYCTVLKFVLKIQEYIHKGANLKFYIIVFFSILRF